MSGSKATKPFSIVVAATRRGVIGYKGTLPWPRLSADMAFFKKLTAGTLPGKRNAVIMGRKTWESIPKKYRPLRNRINIILTRNADYDPGVSLYERYIPESDEKVSNEDSKDGSDGGAVPQVYLCRSFEEGLSLVGDTNRLGGVVDRVFVIGGSEVFMEGLRHPNVQDIHLTQVLQEFPGDVSVPLDFMATVTGFRLTHVGDVHIEQNQGPVPYQFLTYTKVAEKTEKAPGSQSSPQPSSVSTGGSVGSSGEKKGSGSSADTTSTAVVSGPTRCLPPPRSASSHEEYQYLDLISHVLKHGVTKGDRTGVGTRSVFGAQMRFDLSDGKFPLLSTKRVFYRGVVEELLWLVRGDTNAKHLDERKVKIWNDNATRKFLDGRGLYHLEEGDLGPVYGFQWRHFGARYVDCHADYSGKGVDQLAQVIHLIKNNPNSRRILMCAWNPKDIPSMALPPCHVLCQFYVADGTLSCMMYQRSCDLGLGVPFNIASYSLLTIMIAHICGLKPGMFVHTLGDAHVYLTHVKPLEKQIQRKPRPFPRLTIKKSRSKITDFCLEDFELSDYNPHRSIKMKMAV